METVLLSGQEKRARSINGRFGETATGIIAKKHQLRQNRDSWLYGLVGETTVLKAQ
jgi:hypothetical protein